MAEKIDFQPIDFQSDSGIDFQPEQSEESNFFGRVNDALVNRGINIADELNAPATEGFGQTLSKLPRRALRATGQAAGFIGDVGSEALTSAYTTLVPEKAQTAISEAATSTFSDPQYKPFIQGVSRYIEKEKAKNPEGFKDISAMVNIATLGLGSKPIQKLSMSAKEAAIGGLEKSKSALMKKIRSGAVSQDVLKRIKMYEDAHIPWSPADVTESKGYGLIESNLRRNVASADTAAEFDKLKLDAADRYAREIQKTFGGKIDKDIAGKLAQEAGWRRLEAHRKIKDKMFSDFPMKPDTPIETKNLFSTADVLADEIGPTENALLTKLKKLGKDSMGGMHYETGSPSAETTLSDPFRGFGTVTIGKKPPMTVNTIPAGTGGIVDSTGQPFKGAQKASYTWQQLLSDQSALRKLASSTKDYNKRRIYNDLIDAIDRDIVEFSKNVQAPEIKTKLDEAMQFFKHGDSSLPGVKTFRQQDISKMLSSQKPEKIVDTFIRKDNVSNVRRLTATVGDEGMKPIKQAWLDSLISQGEAKSFNPVKFANTFDKMDTPTLKAFLSPDEYEGLKKLSEISKHMGKMERIAGNPSGTAQQSMLASTVSGLFHSPIKTTLSLLGNKKFAEKYFFDSKFRNMLVYRLKNRPTKQDVIKKIEKGTKKESLRESINKDIGSAAPLVAKTASENNGQY